MRILILLLLLLTSSAVRTQPAPCAATTGSDIAKCVNAAYPERLKPTATLKERTENATFLRDRLIETARCAKLDVGLNLKRGGPSISVDFIAWKHPKGHTQGVDVIGGWDDIKKPIKVGWNDSYGPPNYGHPTFKAYGPVSCLIDPEPEPEPEPEPTPDPELLKKIAALELELDSHRQQLAAARKDIQDGQNRIHALQQTIADLEKQKADLKHQNDVLQNRLTHVTCRAAIFGFRIPCTVTIPE